MAKSLHIGIIREGKFPPDSRVALTPMHCQQIQKLYPTIRITVQSSHGRCYQDAEYTEAGIEVKENINDCDLLMGVKEVPV
ncbi:MAG: alanine dehydrogenase, partial [Chitinophagales bacterium]